MAALDSDARRDPQRYAKWWGGMAGGESNPLGARALYLFKNGNDTLYRIHGTNEPDTIGEAVSSGCIRMLNQDVIDLYNRIPSGSKVVVLRRLQEIIIHYMIMYNDRNVARTPVMRPIKLSETVSIAGQPALADFAQLAAQGFKAIVNNRPDGEEAGQPGSAAERRAAEDAGMAYSFIPVTGATITEADVTAFRTAVAQAPGPILAHCKSGTRALTLHVLGEVLDGRMSADAVVGFGQKLGFDLAGAKAWLDRRAARAPQVTGFYEPRTGSIQYVVADPATKACAIIDPVLDYDETSCATATTQADAILAFIDEQGLRVDWILDTHPHADHFSAAQYLKGKTGARTAIGAQVVAVQKLWKDLYNLPDLATDGSQWDRLFTHGERFRLGSLEASVLFSPGHTLASITYVVGDAAFIHDTLFMPDSGTARADFPGGSASALWASIQAILALPDETRLFTGHDYQPHGRAPRWESTVGQQKLTNPHVAGQDEASFVALRQARDTTLPMPKLILHALQVNIRGGRLPEPEANGRRYLKIPLDAFTAAAWDETAS